MKGSATRQNANGAPNPRKNDPIFESFQKSAEETQRRGIAAMQQDMMLKRGAKFLTAMRGAFTVHEISTGLEIPNNCVVQEMAKCTAEWKDEDGVDQTEQFHFLSSPSLALEMHAMGFKNVDQHFKYLEGGFLYLIGEPHLFWSLMMHKRSTGLCFPPMTLAAARATTGGAEETSARAGSGSVTGTGNAGFTWNDTWAMTEVERMTKPVRASLEQGELLITGGAGLKFCSRSLAATMLLANRNFVELLGPVTSLPPPATEVALPGWWRDCEALWGSTLNSCLQRGLGSISGSGSGSDSSGTFPCMFYCTPVGCRAASAATGSSSTATTTPGCCGWHDPQWQTGIERIKNRN